MLPYNPNQKRVDALRREALQQEAADYHLARQAQPERIRIRIRIRSRRSGLVGFGRLLMVSAYSRFFGGRPGGLSTQKAGALADQS